MENNTKRVRLYTYANTPCVCYRGGLLVPVTDTTGVVGPYVDLTVTNDGFTVDGETHWYFIHREDLRAKVARRNMDLLVAHVKKHARENYNKDGWDFIVECFDSADILEILTEEKCTTKSAAVAAMHRIACIKNEQRQEVLAEIF